jgi:hypothetical protein
MVVEATPDIVEHRGWTASDGTRFEGFTEYHVMDAVRK